MPPVQAHHKCYIMFPTCTCAYLQMMRKQEASSQNVENEPVLHELVTHGSEASVAKHISGLIQ